MDTKENRLSLALACLNELIDQGYEFPEALDNVVAFMSVNPDELVSAYDSQD